MTKNNSKVSGCPIDEECPIDNDINNSEYDIIEQLYDDSHHYLYKNNEIIFSNDKGNVIKGLMLASVANLRKVEIICPICKKKKYIEVPVNIVNEANNLTTVSIPKDLICEHHFQAHLDKQFKVRGYQKVDYEISKSHDYKIKNRLKEIYEEFYHLISDYNVDFEEFIMKDPRRQKKEHEKK